MDCGLLGQIATPVAGNPLYIVSGNQYGVIMVVVGAAATAGGILGWPTRWRNRLHQIRDEMKRERPHGG